MTTGLDNTRKQIDEQNYHVWAEGKWSWLPYALWIWNFCEPEMPWRALKPSRGTLRPKQSNCIRIKSEQEQKVQKPITLQTKQWQVRKPWNKNSLVTLHSTSYITCLSCHRTKSHCITVHEFLQSKRHVDHHVTCNAHNLTVTMLFISPLKFHWYP